MQMTRVAIIVMFSALMVFIVIVFFYYSIYPVFRYGSCWGSTVSDVNTLAGIDILRGPETVELGKCTSGFYMVNKQDLDWATEHISDDFNQLLECDDGGESYVIAVPIYTDTDKDYGWNIWEWGKDKLKEALSWAKEKFGITPHCKILDRKKRITNPSAFKGTDTYCFDIGKNEDKTYTVYVCHDECDKCGPNPFNLGFLDDEDDVIEGSWSEAKGGLHEG